MGTFIKRIKVNYCVTNATYANAYGVWSENPPAWQRPIGTSNDWYKRTNTSFNNGNVTLKFADVGRFSAPFSALFNEWLKMLDIDFYNRDDVAAYNVKFYIRNTGSFLYWRLVLYDIINQSQMYDSGDQAGMVSNVNPNFVCYLATYGIADNDVPLMIGFIARDSGISGWDPQSSPITPRGFFFDILKLRNEDDTIPSDPIEYEEVSPEYGDASSTGGYSGGTFDDSSDIISVPSMPAAGVSSAGFINVYNPSFGQLQQFGAELFPDLNFTPVSTGGTPSGVTEALEAIAQIFVDFGNQIPALIDMYINSNLIQYVIDCHIIPVAPTTGAAASVKVGFKTFTPAPAKVTSDYVDFDCGSINVGEYYANFADYAPYTRAKLYLPFVGFVDIQPEYWQSGTLQVKYRFNVIDGSFVAFVLSTSSKSKLTSSVIGQYGGNACVHIPITGLNYANMVSGIVSAASGLLPSSGSGAGIADKLVNSANTIAAAKPSMQQSNGYNATTSFLTVRTPYLLIERSVSNFSTSYDKENGIPSNVTFNFSELTGLTKATMLHLDGIAGATEADLDEIAELLSEGVIL